MKKISVISSVLFLLCFSSCSVSNQTDTNINTIVSFIENVNIDELNKSLTEKNINSFDSNGTTLLTHAIRTKDTSLVKLLLAEGADPNLQNKDDFLSTPLMECSNYDLVETAKILIAHNADINMQDKNGDPVINWTAYYGQVEFTKLLLEHDAKTNLKSIHSDGVMQVALKEWQYDVVELLMEYGIAEHITFSGGSAIIKAVKNNDISYVQKNLPDKNHNASDASGNTLLMIASQKGDSEIAKLLVDHSANIDAINSVGQTALNLAIYFGHTDIAEMLISHNADVNKTDDKFKLTPLEAAARTNRVALGKLLIKHGADINITDGINNFTPIVWATLYQDVEFVKMLLAYNPDLSVVSKYESTVFDMASNDTILQLLNEKK